MLVTVQGVIGKGTRPFVERFAEHAKDRKRRMVSTLVATPLTVEYSLLQCNESFMLPTLTLVHILSKYPLLYTFTFCFLT